ncbi:hypothetical protein HC723_16375 [Vibrio sp. S11_S32]|uniref:YciI family protein n=1 Tax=Vibrio sp. S11_S32 TaxID=2720225 RepID=UPI00168160B2|nr:YciI family protein [Vibrio sp. S11_S32]MBD1577967.1 hypothetical protein [Vibrio sp. S11_S32]
MFVVLCKDSPSCKSLRDYYLKSQSDYMNSGKADIIMSGPLSDANGPAGSMIIINDKSIEIVQTFIKNSPFSKFNIWDDIKILTFINYANNK